MEEKEIDKMYFRYLYGDTEVQEEIKKAHRKTFNYKKFMFDSEISELKENIKNMFRGKNND